MKNILVEIESGVLKIGMNRPEKKNALTVTMYNDIRMAIESAETNDDIKVVLIHGTKELFTAGNDLDDFNIRDFSGPSPAEKLLTVLHRFNKPVIAAVSGLAIGIGGTILLHCDLVYAAPTRFRLPFVNLGVCPEAGSSLLLSRMAGHRRASEILMFGDFFDTEMAITMGLVTRQVDTDELLDFAINKAQELANKPTQAVQVTKQLMKKADNVLLTKHMDEEFKHFGQLLQSEESQKIRDALNSK